MGNQLAQVLAEIVTNYYVLKTLKKFEAETISFFFKYVDDIFSSFHENNITLIKEAISTTTNMELTITSEDDNREVEFLDCVFRRNEDLSVSSRWMKKNYSSRSILNFHSFHPMKMKVNIVREMIKHAYAVTSPEFYTATKILLTSIFRNSSYPEYLISRFLPIINPTPIGKLIRNSTYTTVKRYVSCPFIEPLFNNLQSVANECNLNIKLAPRPSSNNKRVLLSRI